ncbi:hypothetical protein CRUP_018183 [Coryphaenoides rupestris]|nr:hypothetical protein CRUP_018183 [Coryphaenoides rupestris]
MLSLYLPLQPSLLSSVEPLLPSHSFQSQSLRRLPVYQPLHISPPLPAGALLSGVGRPSLPPLPAHHRLRPPHHHHHHDPAPRLPLPPLATPFHSLPRQHASYTLDQDPAKPRPPQKPLPADPLGRRRCRPGLRLPGGGVPLPIPTPTVHPPVTPHPTQGPQGLPVQCRLAGLADPHRPPPAPPTPPPSDDEGEDEEEPRGHDV